MTTVREQLVDQITGPDAAFNQPRAIDSYMRGTVGEPQPSSGAG